MRPDDSRSIPRPATCPSCGLFLGVTHVCPNRPTRRPIIHFDMRSAVPQTPADQRVDESVQLVTDLHAMSPDRAAQYVRDLHHSADAAAVANETGVHALALRRQALAAGTRLAELRGAS